MKAKNIIWDIDLEIKAVDLPNEIEIPDEIIDEVVSNYISDETGFCHNGFELDTDSDTEKYIEMLKSGITEAITQVVSSMENLDNAVATKRITEYMNIEHGIGKFHGLLSVLENISLDEFTKVHDQHSGTINDALRKLEGLYHE